MTGAWDGVTDQTLRDMIAHLETEVGAFRTDRFDRTARAQAFEAQRRVERALAEARAEADRREEKKEGAR